MSDNFIFGLHAVIEAVKSGKVLDKILVQRGLNGQLFNQLRKELQGSDIPYQIVPPEKINRLCGNKNHQGVLAFTSQIEYFKAEDILHKVFEEGKTPLVLILDRVTDVRNFGAIARTADCCGVDMIIVPQRGSAQLNADAVKTSAGALHRLPVCREYNLKETIRFLKESGLQVIACHEKTDKLIYNIDFKIPTVIIMGAEDTGISGEYLKLCDYAVKIPMQGKISSLNVSVATGVVLYEAIRQRI